MSLCLLNVLVAYIGPGAGLGLIGALIAVVSAVMAALLFVVLWPIRMMLRKAKATHQQAAPSAMPGGPAR
jgi:hypothetical protein